MAKDNGRGALIDSWGVLLTFKTEAEYQRLYRILIVRACRALRFAAWNGEDRLLEGSGKSPADYVAETLIQWGTHQLPFTGPPEAVPAFLTKVMTNKIVSTLRKREVQTSRSGKTTLADELTEEAAPQSKPESLFDLRSLLRDGAFRAALDQCVADDEDLKEYVLAIETFEATVPAARDIASLLKVPESEIYNRRRKLARRLGKHGFTGSRRRSNV
jgi:DNA-directed RNA polymerase specialized sigma24 family protein